MKIKKGVYWHGHHKILVEYCYNYQGRVDYIKNDKPEHERKTRLRLFKPVKNVPKDLLEARRKYDEAEQKYDEAWKKYIPYFEKLHKTECGCKEWNGQEIVFKEEKKKWKC